MNKLGRDPLGDALYQTSRIMPYGFRQEDFSMFFSLYKPM